MTNFFNGRLHCIEFTRTEGSGRTSGPAIRPKIFNVGNLFPCFIKQLDRCTSIAQIVGRIKKQEVDWSLAIGKGGDGNFLDGNYVDIGPFFACCNFLRILLIGKFNILSLAEYDVGAYFCSNKPYIGFKGGNLQTEY